MTKSHSSRIKNPAYALGKYAGVALMLIFFLFPIYWNVLNSFKVNVDIFKWPPEFFFRPHLDAYQLVMEKNDFFRFFGNSVIISLATTLFTFIIGGLAAYGFTVFEFPGKSKLMKMTIGLRMVPAITLVLPLFLLMTNLKLVDTYIGITLTYIAFNLSFMIWLTTGYFSEVPKELVQAAEIDGCSHITIFTRIFVPLSAPGLSAVASLVFFGAWNDYLIANTLTRLSTRTLPIVISSFITEQTIKWNALAAVAVLVSIPTIIMTIAFQKYLVAGLTFGAVKG